MRFWQPIHSGDLPPQREAHRNSRKRSSTHRRLQSSDHVPQDETERQLFPLLSVIDRNPDNWMDLLRAEECPQQQSRTWMEEMCTSNFDKDTDVDVCSQPDDKQLSESSFDSAVYFEAETGLEIRFMEDVEPPQHWPEDGPPQCDVDDKPLQQDVGNASVQCYPGDESLQYCPDDIAPSLYYTKPEPESEYDFIPLIERRHSYDGIPMSLAKNRFYHMKIVSADDLLDLANWSRLAFPPPPAESVSSTSLSDNEDVSNTTQSDHDRIVELPDAASQDHSLAVDNNNALGGESCHHEELEHYGPRPKPSPRLTPDPQPKPGPRPGPRPASGPGELDAEEMNSIFGPPESSQRRSSTWSDQAYQELPSLCRTSCSLTPAREMTGREPRRRSAWLSSLAKRYKVVAEKLAGKPSSLSGRLPLLPY